MLRLIAAIAIVFLISLLIKALIENKKLNSIFKNKKFQKILIPIGIIATVILPINIFVLLFYLWIRFFKKIPMSKIFYKDIIKEKKENDICDAYKTLGLELGANKQEIKEAYYKLMQKNHPDKGGCSKVASKLNQAKETLLKSKT